MLHHTERSWPHDLQVLSLSRRVSSAEQHPIIPRLGCTEGHLICYECLYMMFLGSDPPARTCFKCRELLDRPPLFDRTLKILSDNVIPAHISSGDDYRVRAPADSSWVSALSWPPTAAGARSIRKKLTHNQRCNVIRLPAPDDTISVSSDDSVVVLDE